MRRYSLVAAYLIAFALAATASAQGTNDTVLLRYRFQPGQVFHYRLSLNGNLGIAFSGITPPPGARMPGRMPVTMAGSYEFSQTVQSVTPSGAAVVSLGIDKMELNTGTMGMDVVIHLDTDGKMETLMNGRPMRLPNAPAVHFSNPFYEATIDPTGTISGVNPESTRSMSQLFGGQNIASMFTGLPGMGGLVLPSQPVKVGDTWDNQFELRMPLPTPGVGGAAPGGLPTGAILSMSFAVHNKLVRVENGSAIIETRMTAALPAGARVTIPAPAGRGMPAGIKLSIVNMAENAAGTQRFNIDQGAAEASDLSAELAAAMSLVLPPGMGPGAAPRNSAARRNARGTASVRTARPPGAAAPTHLKIAVDGVIKMKMERLNAPSAPPAAPAAPAPPSTAPATSP